MAEKIFIITLGKEVKKVCSWRKSKRGVRTVQRFLLQHLKREIKIGGHLNRYLNQFGRKSAPRRVKVKVAIVEDKDRNFAYAELFDAPMPDFSLDKKEIKKEEKKLEEKVEVKPEEKKEVKTEIKKKEKIELKAVTKKSDEKNKISKTKVK